MLVDADMGDEMKRKPKPKMRVYTLLNGIAHKDDFRAASTPAEKKLERLLSSNDENDVCLFITSFSVTGHATWLQHRYEYVCYGSYYNAWHYGDTIDIAPMPLSEHLIRILRTLSTIYRESRETFREVTK